MAHKRKDRSNPEGVTYTTLDNETLTSLGGRAEYTAPILKERLLYVSRLLKEDDEVDCDMDVDNEPVKPRQRVVSCRAKLLLQQYKRALDGYYANEDESVKNTCIDSIMSIDQFLDEVTRLRKEQEPVRVAMKEKMAQLQKMVFYARYGDYLARELMKLKTAAVASGDPTAKHLYDYWTNIYQKIELGREDLLVRENRGSEDARLFVIVAQTASSIGWTTDKAFTIIKHYATRNEIMHNSVSELLQHKKYADLAKTLYDDLESLGEAPIPDSLRAELRETILELRDQYFTMLDDCEDEPQGWVPKPEAVRASKLEAAKASEKQKKIVASISSATKLAVIHHQVTEG